MFLSKIMKLKFNFVCYFTYIHTSKKTTTLFSQSSHISPLQIKHHDTGSERRFVRAIALSPGFSGEEGRESCDFHNGLLSAVWASISVAGALPCLASHIQSMPSWPPVATMCCWFGCLATQCRGTLSPVLGDNKRV